MTASSASSSPPRSTTVMLRECAICQTSIEPSEETLPCPACGLVYHAECWQENYGCAAYGCTQVNALAPKIDIPAATTASESASASASDADDDAPAERLPWDFALLGAAALAMVASALSFGLPSLLAASGVAWRMRRTRGYRKPILVAAAVLCAVGIVGGIAVSRFWFTQVDYLAVGPE